MKISYNWIKQLIALNNTPEEISALLTKSGLEVEGLEPFESLKGGLNGFVVAEVLTCERHPDADKLSKTTVDLGNNVVVPIVCGAPNVAAGQKVIVATVGATVYPLTGEPFAIKKAKIRGEVSEGMICAEDEIGIGAGHDGILVLNTDLPNGTPAADYFGIENDIVIEIGLTPNRADAASHLGVARDLKALLNSEICLPENNIVAGNQTKVKVTVENADAAPRYTGLVIENLEVKSSPDWLKNRLKVIGLNPINNIVDATNYVLHELGQPLHAFDLAKIKGNEINVKFAAEGTKFVTLDGVERTLKANDLVIANAEEPMCLAGVFGGKDSGVSDSTTAIFLESAYFNPAVVRKSSLQHGLKTDSSFRFERGTDPNMPAYALQRAAKLILEVAGGTITSPVTDLYPNPIADFEVNVTFKNIKRLIGIEIPKEQIKTILTNLGITIAQETEEGLNLLVPPFKVDVQREADIVEEIIRIFGFDNIPTAPHLGAAFLANFPEKNPENITNTLANDLVAKGFNEIISNSLTKPSYFESLPQYPAEKHVEILNKLSEELAIMRPSLLFSGLEALAFNINRKQNNLKLFEIGKTYQKGEDKYVEENVLGLWLSGNVSDETWLAKNKKFEFSDLATALQDIFSKLNLKNITTEKISNEIFAYGIEIKLNNKTLGFAGLVNKVIAKLADLKQEVFYAELNLKSLIKAYSSSTKYAEISKFPEVRRDLALVIDKKISFDEIKKLAFKAEKKLLKEINVFDVFEGEQIGADKKSYSVSFILQDATQTLTDKQIDQSMAKLMETFEKEINALIRK